ncbi:hypothetical protein AMTRI_Chr02g254060 [Amborella trichopoda]
MVSHKISFLLAMLVVLSLLGHNACLAARGRLDTPPMSATPSVLIPQLPILLSTIPTTPKRILTLSSELSNLPIVGPLLSSITPKRSP